MDDFLDFDDVFQYDRNFVLQVLPHSNLLLDIRGFLLLSSCNGSMQPICHDGLELFAVAFPY